MTVTPAVQSSRHPLVRAIRDVGVDGGIRRRMGVCVLEGTHLVAEAIALDLPLVVALGTPEFMASPKGGEMIAALRRLPVRPVAGLSEHVPPDLVVSVAPHALKAAGELQSPSVLAVVRTPDVAAAQGGALALDGVQDPGNVGALSRALCAFAGARALLLAGPGTADPYGAKALRASAGAVLRLAVRTAGDLAAEARADGQASGRSWWALQPRGGRDLDAADVPSCWGLIVGNEGHGCSGAVTRAFAALTLPMTGDVESLGVAQAGAIALYLAHRGACRGARTDRRGNLGSAATPGVG